MKDTDTDNVRSAGMPNTSDSMQKKIFRMGPGSLVTIAFILLIIGLFFIYEVVDAFNSAQYVSSFSVILLSTVFFVFTVIGITAVRILIYAVSTQEIVIPTNDRKLLEPLIEQANEKAIDQYVRLSSLAGATGTATKLGLTGLPLATVALTVFFSLLALFNANANFFDLAKLTLGAFIGSFVQRTVSAQAVADRSAASRLREVSSH